MKRRRAIPFLLAMVGGLAGASASAQSLANPVINEFERAPAGSLEWDILDRMSSMNRYDPRDLFRLSRMTVLESIAMYENLRADLPGSLTGAVREGEMSYLWDSAELFYVSVTPSDAISLARSRPLLGDVEAAYARLSATLGAMPGQSPQAALHLRNIGRMLPIMNTLIDAMEADRGVPAVGPVEASGVEQLRAQARGLVDDLRLVERWLRQGKPAAGRDDLIADLDGLIDQAQGLDRMLTVGAPAADIVEAFQLLRGRMWPVEARFLRVAGAAGRWSPIRARMREISDRLDQPRIIAAEPVAAPRPAADVDRRLLAGVDRAVVAMDDDLSRLPTDGNGVAAVGLQMREELADLRRRLWQFRERVAAGQPPASLSRSLRPVEDLGKRLEARARSEARVFRGGEHLDPRGFRRAAESVAKLRALLSEGPGNAPRHEPTPPDTRPPAGAPDRR